MVRALPLFIVALVGCTTGSVTAGSVNTAPVTPAGPACVGTITAPESLAPVTDEALLASAVGRPEEGKLCAARVYEARSAVTVYRLWNRAQPYTQFGRWWTLERPTGPIERIREALEVCPEWSPLDALSVCTLRAGSRVALGTGQSTRCERSVHYGTSSALQLYIPNDTRATPQVVLVEDCREITPWP
jgi:hypothetical protein